MDLMSILSALNNSHGPAGDEEGVRDALRSLAEPLADDVRVDALGNLIVHRKGDGPKVMLCAHMDSIGFIITHIEKEGFLRFGRLGGLHAPDLCATPVRFANGVWGVVCVPEDADPKELKLEQLCIDVGADSEEEVRAMGLDLGDTAVYNTTPFTAGKRIFSPYLDNRISCTVLLQVLEALKGQPVHNDFYAVFSVQEELGLRGARTAAYAIEPDYALALDVTIADDEPGTKHSATSRLGKGAAIKVMDHSVICHPQVVSKLRELAKEGDIPAQTDIIRAGGTDAGAIHQSRGGVLTGGISVPCRYTHTPLEMVDERDVEACVRLATAFVQAELPTL